MNIPDRLSCDRTSLYYMPNFIHNITVKVNGKLGRCIEYCISEKWAICYVFDENGHCIVEDAEFKIETITNADIEVELA